MTLPLAPLFSPRSIAVVGASRMPGKVGYEVLNNLVRSRFRGAVYPVNPQASTLLGLPAFPDIQGIPGEADLAVLAIPAPAVLEAIRQLSLKGTKIAVVISAGFKETGPAGAALERDVVRAAREGGIRVIGPNCLGVVDTVTPYNASFSDGMPHKGVLGLFSQSGALCTAILDWARPKHIGFSRVVSFGNRSDITETDLLLALAQDEHTRAIVGYLEGVADGPAFLDAASRITPRKPVIMIKAGSTAAGSKAAASHTGSLAGSDQAFDAAARKTGIIRARSVDELFRYAKAFASYAPPKGNRVAVITNAGGPGIMAADAVENSELDLASLGPDTVDALRPHLPPAASLHNPVDIIGDAQSDRYQTALAAVLGDPGVDSVCVLLTPQAMTDTAKIAQVILDASRRTAKPVFAVLMGDATIRKGAGILQRGGLPNYSFPEEAVSALEALEKYRQWTNLPLREPVPLRGDASAVRGIIGTVGSAGHPTLSAGPAMDLLAAWGIPVPGHRHAATGNEAVAAADSLGYPVVLKIDSPDILHKTDLGGVVANIRGREEVRDAFRGIMASVRQRAPHAVIAGVTVWRQVEPGREVILGGVRDPQFGPLVMFGLGGIYVEVLKDVGFALAPLSREEAETLVRSLKAFPLLEGARGRVPADRPFLLEMLIRFATLLADFPEIVEADINPLVLHDAGKGGMAVDARFTIEGERR